MPKASAPGAREVCWLHLSDAHIGNPRHDWEAEDVLRTLLDDLRAVQEEHGGLRPSLLFFTGDLAFGALPDSPLPEQYERAAQFLRAVREVYTPAIPADRVFIVPGNHDVNRNEVADSETKWLDDVTDGLQGDPVAVVNEMIRAASKQWRRFMERLYQYRDFLAAEGYDHLLADRERLVFASRRAVAGLDVGIVGLNTAWSASRIQEQARLWLGRWQATTARQSVRGCPVTLALSHHPTSWLTHREKLKVEREIAREFDFHLHGHEHDTWVTHTPGHVRIAAGACYARSDKAVGYNLVRLFPDERRLEVILRTYDERGGGWTSCPIHGEAPDGVWHVAADDLLPRLATPGVAPGTPTPDRDTGEHERRAVTRRSFDLSSHFLPGKEMEDEDRFVGRKRELQQGLEALRSPGGSIIVFGNAGVGKSSVALQIAQVASGRKWHLVDKYDLRRLVPQGGFRHPVAHYRCLAHDTDLGAMLGSLLRDATPPFPMAGLLASERVRAELAKPMFQATAAQLQALLLPPGPGLTGAPGPGSPGSLVSLFRNLAHAISQAHEGRELVVVLDELDQVDRKGLAGLIKGLDCVTFVLVGTAVDLRQLVEDHASIHRQIAEGTIRLLAMSREDLTEIIRREEQRSDGAFRFRVPAVERIVRSCHGSPFFAHYLGRYSLDEALGQDSREPDLRGRISVREEHVERALHTRLQTIEELDGPYRRAGGTSWKRELVLKLLALRIEDDIATAHISRVAAGQGVQHPGGQVVRLAAEGVLRKVGDTMYRFDDTRFKVYARLRPPIFEDNQGRLAFALQGEGARESERVGWAHPG